MSAGSPADLQAIFASIKPRPSPSPGGTPDAPTPDTQQRQQQQQWSMPPRFSPGPPGPNSPPSYNTYTQPFAPSYFGSPMQPNPRQTGSGVISPNVSSPISEHNQQQAMNTDRTAHLLNLLRFSQPAASPPAETGLPSGITQRAEGTPDVAHPAEFCPRVSTSDVATPVVGRTGAIPVPDQSTNSQARYSPAERSPLAGVSGENAQELLLKLLNRPKPQQLQPHASLLSSTPSVISPPPNTSETADILQDATLKTEKLEIGGQVEQAKLPSMEERKSSPIGRVASAEPGATAHSEPPPPTALNKESIFRYTNPFEDLAAASPRNLTPKHQAHSGRGSPAAENVATEQEPEVKQSPEALKPSPALFTTSLSKDEKAESDAHLDQPASTLDVQKSSTEWKGKEPVPAVTDEVATKSRKKRAVKEPKLDHSEATTLNGVTDGTAEPKYNDTKEKIDPKESKPNVTSTVQATQPFEENAQQENDVENWEAEADADRIVPVYNFPLKPFVVITWRGDSTQKPLSIREDAVMPIARLKKGFDQLDRSLTSATSDYIVYALTKNGGARIIRQDNGHDKQVFRFTNDRIFNVSVSQSPAGAAIKEHTFLGIGISGAVYWTTISRGDEDFFETDMLESEGLIFPPFPASDENTSGGQLKTRVKHGSRHPEFFAIGRGKSIHVVWPRLAVPPKPNPNAGEPYRKVDTEKFFKKHSIKIATGKAGKDFVFSDDDSVIVSLDKTGRMRFWDIRDIDNIYDHSVPKPDIRIPQLTLVTGSPNEKSWPTSVLFIDKQRPYLKANALRYMLVGLKQNHTLQLWDLGLGKAVQELNFPHSNESDAICSVAYHPASGFIVVGHPTRNSIYFIHLSAPRYSLPSMSQASFVQAVAEKDPNLPKPESTACMSGIRELSLGAIGQLRSLELLPLSKSSQRGAEEESGLFELYVMHSRGVTCLTVKKLDLGWSFDNKIIHSIDALGLGYIDIKDLQTFQPPLDDVSTRGEGQSPKTPVESKRGHTVVNGSTRSESPKKSSRDAAPIAEQAPGEKAEKKRKKKLAGDTSLKPKEPTKTEEPADAQTPATSKPTIPQQDVQADQESEKDTTGQNGIGLHLFTTEVRKIEQVLTSEFTKCLNSELETVYRRFEEDRRAQDAAATARQDAVLRLISSTLSENVERSLSRIISENLQSQVVPSLNDSISVSLDKHVSAMASQQLPDALAESIKAALPDAVTRSMPTQETVRALSETMIPAIATKLEKEITNTIHNMVIPAFKDEQARTVEIATKEVEQRYISRINNLEGQQIRDSVKIDELTSLVRSMAETVSTIAAAQNTFSAEFLKFRNQFASGQQEAHQMRPTSSSSDDPRPTPPSAEETEFVEIEELMKTGKYEEASVRWLQSSQQADLFENLFIHYDPSYLANLPPLIVLSVSAAVTSAFGSNIMDRLNWLQYVFRSVNVQDPDINEVTPRIMDVLIHRLETLYMSIAENKPQDPVLRRIPPLTNWARDLKQASFRVAR
ncbi:hypothetical protein FQN57_001161 [Myotisia sp. PD_48]|nr:hypothetical protein FQN57_001161 [Myotisia sp. PD_48]